MQPNKTAALPRDRTELNEFLRRLFAFGGMSVLSFVVNLGLTMLLHEVLGTSEELAYAVALFTVFVMNFMISRHVIFRAVSGSPVRQIALFAISSLSFRGLEYLLFLLFHTVMGFWYVGVIISISIPMTFVKFFFHGTFVFVPKREADTASD